MGIAALDHARASWPAELTVADSGRLEFDGCDLTQLAHEHGTPLWAISATTIESNFAHLAGTFMARYPRCEIAYSVKAHNTLAVIRLLHRCGAKMDCSAEYECQLALLCGVPPADIILNGNGKSDSALHAAAAAGFRQVNVDSLDQVRRLEQLAEDRGVQVPCMVRIQLGYENLLDLDPSFETTLRVGEGKFGASIRNGQALETVAAVVQAEHLDFVGLSHHVGFSGYMGDYSVERELMHHRECTQEVCEFANEVHRRHGISVDRLDLGGGFRSGGAVLLSTPGGGGGVAFHPLPKAEEYAEAVFDTLERTLIASDLPLVQFETGGYQIANAVVLLTSVSEVKDVVGHENRRYVVVDGSMMMFVSRGMMRVGHPILVAGRGLAQAAPEWPVEVVGQTCVYDSLAENIGLPDVERGDVLVLLHQGAYCETQATQFNAFPRPEVVLLREGTAHVVKRRETIADIHGRDVIPVELWAGR